jgi:hypothetical protein
MTTENFQSYLCIQKALTRSFSFCGLLLMIPVTSFSLVTRMDPVPRCVG